MIDSAKVDNLISTPDSFAVLERAAIIFGPTGAPPVGLCVLSTLCPPILPRSVKSAPFSISQSTISAEELAIFSTKVLLFVFFPPFIVSSIKISTESLIPLFFWIEVSAALSPPVA